MAEQELKKSLFEMFAASQETFEEAKKKSIEEASKRATYFHPSKDGTYIVRIMPLAPVIDSEGNVLPPDRKGYEYPLRSLMLKIADTASAAKGKAKTIYVNVCNAKQVFKNLEADLIDVYVQTTCDLYADDEALCKKIRSNSFEGGLRWDSRRCMYILDYEHRNDGLQILQLSFAQYKDLEERKLNLWNKLNKKQRVACPISSIGNAYPLEITRKTENNKVSYSFNIDTVSGVDELSEEELQNLIEAQRLPEIIYRYTRYHLEATIVYLTQLDEKFNIEVMKEPAIQDCIEQIKMLLPADDQSHFTMNGAKSDGASSGDSDIDELDALWATFDKIDEAGLDDKSAEGQELRTSIKEFIESKGLNIAINRGKNNQGLLNEIEKKLAGDESELEDEPEPTPRIPAQKPESDEVEPEADESDDEPEEQEDRHFAHRERNDDTNEPAAQPSRRGSRPLRRR